MPRSMFQLALPAIVVAAALLASRGASGQTPGDQLPLWDLAEMEEFAAEEIKAVPPLPAPQDRATSSRRNSATGSSRRNAATGRSSTPGTSDDKPPIARLRPHKDKTRSITPANLRNQPHELPAPDADPYGGQFFEGAEEIDTPKPLPPLDEELWLHGGSYLYAPEGDHFNWPAESGLAGDCNAHTRVLRLPEDWHAPQPVTAFDSFLGTGPIPHADHWRWPKCGYHWDPRLVLYGSYELIAAALEENNTRHDVVGHQLLLDLDFRLTGTERLHVQWRPIGEENTGGSFYRFSDPEGYVDNSTGIPDRYWVEWELASVLGDFFADPFVPRDYHTVVGKFPFAAHNQLLINDDILGFAVNKNNIYLGTLSNLNIQGVVALDDVEAFSDASANLYMLNSSADYRHSFIEATYAYVQHGRDSARDTQYAALSGTMLCGPHTLAGRSLFRIAPTASGGSGELYVLEYNRAYSHGCNFFGVEKSVLYATAFHSTQGWQSISGGNFNRVRTAFAVDPLIPLSAARSPDDNVGAALGWQLFRHEEDESLLPEVAYDAPGGDSVWGVGLRYQRKTGPRSFFEVQGVYNWSDNPTFRREGVFMSETIVF